MIDITLLRILKNHADFKKLHSHIPINALDQKTKTLISAFSKYFKKFPEHGKIDFQVFIPRFIAWNPTMDKETLGMYKAIIKQCNEDVEETTKAGIVADLYEIDTAFRIANLCAQYEEGELDAPFPALVSSIIDAYKIQTGALGAVWNQTDISELLEEDLNDAGIKWRLSGLRECMRPLRIGDFGIIGGRPDVGKTTFLASETTYMAPQLEPDKNIIWLNNESYSGRIVKRVYQSALGLPMSKIIQLNKQSKLRKMYEKAVGRLDKIRVYDIHGMHVGQVEAILEQSNPGIIIYDMIDNIRGFGNAARNDLQLEEMYKWGRECSVKYGSIGLATSQISAEGEGMRYPLMHMLKDSKTGKQGACDFQIMIGAVKQQGLENIRFIGVPKNKLRREGAKANPEFEVVFNGETARYADAETLTYDEDEYGPDKPTTDNNELTE